MDHEDDRFPRFLDLPAELRDQIWRDALPEHGVFLVQCDPVDIAHADKDDIFGYPKAVRLALRPARHGPHDSDYQKRVRTNKSLLATCFESRAVVCKLFPDTLDDAGPRLSFQEDLIYVVSEFLRGLTPDRIPLCVDLEFEGGWNKLIRRLAFHCDCWQIWPRFEPPNGIFMPMRLTFIDRFMEFLTACTSLKQVFLTTSGGVSLDSWDQLSHERRHLLSKETADCYGGLTCQPDVPLTWHWCRLTESLSVMRQDILD